jgi:transcriptional antiterminator NusG
MGVEKREVVLDYQVGDTVRIYEGVLKGQLGVVTMIDVDNNQVHLSVTMANRPTNISLQLNAVEYESH